MVDHWMVMDVVHQTERALFYRPAQEASLVANWEKLQQTMAETESRLQQARNLYKVLYREPTNPGLPSLTARLDELESTEVENERAAVALLQRVGERLNPGNFQAMVVTKPELEPAWDLESALGTNYQPARILFGSTAAPGDNRVLPLRFDFGKGVFGFYIPMEQPSVLALDSSIQKESAPAYEWMKQHRTGYHYWAGVYNNQNTYVAPWFVQQHHDDADVWMKLADGKVLRPSGGDWGQVNIWNLLVQDYVQDYCAAQARALSHDPFLLGYDYTAEPHPWGSQPPTPPAQPQYSGYNESAVRAFRDYLRQQFPTIPALNSAWHSHYTSFESIQAPPDPYVSLPERATPLSYEFERFRCQSHTHLWRMIYEAYRKYDTNKPVIANAGMYMSGWPVEALDTWQLQKAGVADWIDMHMNNFWPNLPEQIYLYSLCRLTGKVPVQFEYIWTFPRTGPVADTNETDFRATCQASIWRNLVWGKKALVFFDVAYDWPAYHNAFLDRDLGYSILRPSVCVVPTLKRKALQFNNLYLKTEVVTPPIIVLQPSASIWNSPPVHPNQGFSFHTSVAGTQVHPLLFSRNYPFLYVPEEAVLEDGYDLSQHQAIILPQAPYLPAEMTARLLEWIKEGGTLICLGPPGLWNGYGQDDLRLITQVFGPGHVRDEKPGRWQWSWRMLAPKAQVETIRDASGKLVATRTPYGQGEVMVSLVALDTLPVKDLFYQMLDAAIGQRPAACAKDAFELVLREDQDHRRYLFVLNPHTREVREDQIILTGKHAACIDLGIGSGVPLPITVQNNETRFNLRLHPGEGTVIELGAL